MRRRRIGPDATHATVPCTHSLALRKVGLESRAEKTNRDPGTLELLHGKRLCSGSRASFLAANQASKASGTRASTRKRPTPSGASFDRGVTYVMNPDLSPIDVRQKAGGKGSPLLVMPASCG